MILGDFRARMLVYGDSSADRDYFYHQGQCIEQIKTSTGKPDRQFVVGDFLYALVTMDVNTDGDDSCTGVSDERYFYQQNTIYSVYGITNENGELIEAYEYDPYGKHVLISDGNDGDSIVNFNGNDVRTAFGTSLISNPLMHTSQNFDPETGIYYFKLRYYHPVLAIFISVDLIGHAVGINLYQYVKGRALVSLDPLGLYEFEGWPTTPAPPLSPDEIYGLSQDQNPDMIDQLLNWAGITYNDPGRLFARHLLGHYIYGNNQPLFHIDNGLDGLSQFVKDRPEVKAVVYTTLQAKAEEIMARARPGQSGYLALQPSRNPSLYELNSMQWTLGSPHIFHIRGNYEINETCDKIRFYNMSFIWIDAIDLHWNLSTDDVPDAAVWFLLRVLADADGGYNIQIKWYGDSVWAKHSTSRGSYIGYESGYAPQTPLPVGSNSR